MKTVTWIMTSFIILLSCENPSHRPDSLSGKLVSHSECKSNWKIACDPSSSCIEYSYNNLSSTLTINHINAAFNCCPDSIYCDVSLIGDEIHINECEKQPLCNCMCLFDLEIEIDGLNQGLYKIVIGEPYIEEQERISFDINLFAVKQGTYCSQRNTYPWVTQ